jgi:16S rRNA (guanine1207-N2)-methyltransferase
LNVTPTPEKPCDNALIFCHRSKPATLNLIAVAAQLTHPGGLILVDGAKTDGIDSIRKELRAHFDQVQAYSKAHGKLLWLKRPADLPDLTDWPNVTYLYPNGWTTHAASFSSDGPDPGSKLLAEILPQLGGRVADLGAGWGYLSAEILKSEAVTALSGFEADFHATASARHNVQDPRAVFTWCDVRGVTENGFDAVVMNPPFHVGRKADPALGVAFITQAAKMLKPKGQLWMVANRNLPYEETLNASFRHVKTHAERGGFKVISGQGPKTPRPGR